MNPIPSSDLTRHPKKSSPPEHFKSPPPWWRSACASLSLAVLTLGAVSASAQNWIDTDLGGPAVPGYTVTNSDGTLDIWGAGGDIWNDTSQCHYRYAWASGTTWDATIQVTNLIGGDATWTKCELMVDWANPATGPQGSDPFIAAMNTLPVTATDTGADNEYGVDQFRTASGGPADWKQEGTSPHPVYPNVWMRIHRNGSIFSIYYSSNNVTWYDYIDIDTSSSSLVGQDSGTTFGTPWPDLVCVGIAVTSHNNTPPSIADATIANVSTTFGGITAPTVVNPTVQVTNYATHLGSEASFSFVTTNNSLPNPNLIAVQPNYQWFTNGVAASNATGTSFTWLAKASDAGMQVYCTATMPPPYNTSVTSVTSATGTLSVASGIIVTNGLKVELFSGAASRPAVEAGNVAPASSIFLWNNWDNPGGLGNYYVDRVSGYFIAPTSDNYVFYDASDDDSDLYLSTNSAAENKELIAQSTAWTDADNWLALDYNGVAAADSTGRSWAQAESDTFVDPVSGLTPFASGIPLIAGHLYYIEGVHYQGTGGDCFTVTYQTATMLGGNISAPSTAWQMNFTNGTPSLLYATNNNIAFISYPDTTPIWTLQPTNNTVTAGTGGGFAAAALSGGEFAPNYQWYSNSVAIPGATSSSLYYAIVPNSANGAQFYCVATGIMNGLSSTSSVATLQIASGVQEPGWVKVEWWYGDGLAALEAGTLGTAQYTITSPTFESDSTGSSGNNYANRLSTLFYPPTTGNYVFFVNSDDQSDLFVSTDATPGNKRLVAQEAGWDNAWQWNSANGASTVAQKRSDQWTTNGMQPWAAGIPMNAGQPYYIEMDHQDTGGGEDAEATFKLTTDPDPVNGTHSRFIGTNIAISVPRSFYVGFTQQPTNVTANTFGFATFSAAGATDSQVAVGGTGNDRPLWNNKIAYQWTKNGVPIPGATSSSYSIGPVSAADNNDQFVCQIRSLGYVNNSGVDIWSNSVAATLTIAAGQVLETGYGLHEFWSANPTLGQIETGTAGAPNWIMSAPAFETDITGTEVADNFSDVELGFFIPPTSDNYVFFVGADDTADLLLSTNSSFTGLQIIAQQTGYAGTLDWGTGGSPVQTRSDTWTNSSQIAPFASGIPLVAGQKYAMELVHNQGGGGTWAGVTVMTNTDPNYPNAPAAGTLSDIRGGAVASYFPRCTYVNITNQPQSLTVNNYASASFSITAGTDSTTPIGPEGDWRNYFNNFLTYQWYKNGVAIAGANAATYTLPLVLPSDNNDQIVCETRALGYADGSGNPLWVTSQTAKLTVVTNAPQLLYAAFYDNTNFVAFGFDDTNYIVLAFSEPMDPVMLGQASTYTLPPGLSILSIVVNTNDYMSVALGVSGTITLPLNVQVSASLSGMGGGLPVSSTTVALHPSGLTDADIGVPGVDPAVPGMMYVEGANAYTIACEGSDIYNNADGFNFAFELKTNDFDVVVRQKDIKHTSNWAKGGLMVRETLDAGSRNWNIINDPVSSDGIDAPDNSGFGANAVECNTRNTTDGSSGGWNFNPSPVPAYPNAWVRLKRTGNLLSAFYSTNGTSWTLQATNDPTQVGQMTALPAVVYVGLCTTAHNNDPLGTAPSQLKYLNTVDYDNYNSSYVGGITLHATVAAGNIIVSWVPAGGTLWSSPALSGPNENWTQVGTANPATIPITAGSLFFKVSNP